jgi:zinc protease
MKTAFASRLALWLLAIGLTAGTARADISAKYDPKNLVTPALHAIPKVTPQRSVLPNGLVLYLLEDHSRPVFRGTMYFRSSSTWAPADQAGLGEITASAMRSGGSAAKTGDYLDDRLGGLGASIGANLTSDLGSANFHCLAENTAEVLGDFAEVLRRPAFPDDKIELAKVGMRRQIAGRNDDMIPMLTRVASQAVYGKDSPWVRMPEYATVDAITRDDCVKMHALAFVPNRADSRDLTATSRARTRRSSSQAVRRLEEEHHAAAGEALPMTLRARAWCSRRRTT